MAKEAKKKRKQFYSYLKSRTANRQSIGPLKDGEKMVTDNRGMASLLNTFFSSVFTKETLPAPDPIPMECDSSIADVMFSSEKVEGKLKALKTDSAGGPDLVSSQLIKETANIVFPFVYCLLSIYE